MHDFIVRVFAKYGSGQKDRYLGTAFLIDDCYLLTNRHVIKEFSAKDLYLSDGPWFDHITEYIGSKTQIALPISGH